MSIQIEGQNEGQKEGQNHDQDHELIKVFWQPH